jgi:hypothetical protein
MFGASLELYRLLACEVTACDAGSTLQQQLIKVLRQQQLVSTLWVPAGAIFVARSSCSVRRDRHGLLPLAQLYHWCMGLAPPVTSRTLCHIFGHTADTVQDLTVLYHSFTVSSPHGGLH